MTQVVPRALLDFSRSVMREKFSAIVQKPIFTFNFDRAVVVQRDLHSKLVIAKDTRAIICTTPGAIKSFFLKFVELLHMLDESRREPEEEEPYFVSGFAARILQRLGLQKATQRKYTPELVASLGQQAGITVEILGVFQQGALILDEVDLILHPLKSELNWPLGKKKPLDLTRNRSDSGLRWKIPWFLLDAIFSVAGSEVIGTTSEVRSREGQEILKSLRTEISQGYVAKHVQATPHIVVLNREYYHTRLQPLLTNWMMIWLKQKQVVGVSDEQLRAFLLHGPLGSPDATGAGPHSIDYLPK